MKYFKTFENFSSTNDYEATFKLWNDLEIPNLTHYVQSVMLLPQFFKDFSIVNLTDAASGKCFSFKTTRLADKDNERHKREHWHYILAFYNDNNQVEISCTNTGDGEVIDSLADLFDYTNEKYDHLQIWKTLIAANGIYKLECPPKILEQLKDKLAPAAKIGVFENLKEEEITDPRILEYYKALELLPEFFHAVGVFKQDNYDILDSESQVIEFEDVRIIKAEDNNGKNVGEYWQYEIAILDDEINIICIQTGENQVLKSLSDLFKYTSPVEIETEIWKTLMSKNATYKLECPPDILEKLKEKESTTTSQ